MVILTAAGLALSFVSAQDPKPEDEAPAVPVVQEAFLPLARAYPKSTIGVFGWNTVTPHLEELRQTGLGRMLETLSTERTERLLEQASRLTGIPGDLIRRLPEASGMFGVTAITDTGDPAWLATFELGDDTGRWLELLQTLCANSGVKFDTELWEGTDVLRLTHTEPLADVALAVHGTVLVTGVSREVFAALDRLDGRDSESLVRDQNYRNFKEQVTADTHQVPLAVGYLNPSTLVHSVLPRLPDAVRQYAGRVYDGLQLARIAGVGFMTTANHGYLHDVVRVSFPEPRGGLLAAFLEAPSQLDLAVSRQVPEDVVSFALTHVRFDQLFEHTLELAATIEPSARGQIRTALSSLRDSMGLDIERDIIPNLGRSVVTMQWQSPGGEPEFAALVQLASSLQLDATLRKINLLTASTVDGFNVYAVDDKRMPIDGLPTLATGERLLVIAAPRSRFDSLLAHLGENTENKAISALMRHQPRQTVSVGWTDLSAMARSWLRVVRDRLPATGGLDLDAVAASFDELSAHLGTVRSSLITDPGGVTIEAHSESGQLLGFVVAGLAAAAATFDAETLAANRELENEARQKVLEAKFGQLVETIATAQLDQRQSASEFVDLEMLIATGLVDADSLGVPAAQGANRLDDYLITVLLPDDDAQRGDHFAIVAWPADSRPGEIFVCTEKRQPLANDLLARDSGIDVIKARDLFVDSEFGGEMTLGWRRLEVEADLATTSTQLDTPVVATDEKGDREAFLAILAVEDQQDTPSPRVLIPMLASPNPKVAARAAYALGKRKFAEAVPNLIDAVTDRVEPDVRTHALEALKKIRDKRSLQVSLDVLDEADPTLRTLAAANLGRLRDATAIDPLLAFLSESSQQEGDQSRAQAVLALADIGDASVLVRAAAAVREFDRETEQGLAYMFQSLSPKLGDDEVNSLMAVLGHPSPMLRRYAIQRLTELGDPNSATALQARLGKENDELRPLVEVAVRKISGADDATPASVGEWIAVIERNWNGMTAKQRGLIVGVGGGLLSLVIVLSLWGRRRRRSREADVMAAMVAPSEDFDTGTYDAYEDDQWGEDAEFQDGDYSDEFAEEQWSENDEWAEQPQQ